MLSNVRTLIPYPLLSVVFLLRNISSHPKVSNLEHKSFSDQDVASSQVTVDYLQLYEQQVTRWTSKQLQCPHTHLYVLQVFQPTGNLQSKVLHILHVEQSLAVDVVVSEWGH